MTTLSTDLKLTPTERLIKFALAEKPMTLAELIDATGSSPVSFARKINEFIKHLNLTISYADGKTYYSLPASSLTE